jgi:hypothetical protein
VTIVACHKVHFTCWAVIWSRARDVVVRRLHVIVFMMMIELIPKSPESPAIPSRHGFGVNAPLPA